MKIHFRFEVWEDDIEQLKEDFETIEFVEKAWNEDSETSYEQIVVDTEDLDCDIFEDWIQNWLNAGYILSFNDWKYELK